MINILVLGKNIIIKPPTYKLSDKQNVGGILRERSRRGASCETRGTHFEQ